MRCLIVDDDDIQRTLLEQYVNELDQLEIVATCEDAVQALKVLQSESVDLVFLDVEMPGMSGLDLLESLTDKPNIILVTSHEKYAVSAFDYDVIDYLVKPIEFPRLVKAVNKVMAISNTPVDSESLSDDHIFVKDGKELIKLSTSDILYITALGDYITVTIQEGDHTILSTLGNFYDKLPSEKFIRVHRSYIVRVDKINKIADHIIEINNQTIPVSKSYRNELYIRLNTIQ